MKPENKKKHLITNELAKKSFVNNFSYNFKRNRNETKKISQSENSQKSFSSEELYSIIEQITGDRPMKYSQLFLSQYRKGCF